jgi:hypothetical protein
MFRKEREAPEPVRCSWSERSKTTVAPPARRFAPSERGGPKLQPPGAYRAKRSPRAARSKSRNSHDRKRGRRPDRSAPQRHGRSRGVARDRRPQMRRPSTRQSAPEFAPRARAARPEEISATAVAFQTTPEPGQVTMGYHASRARLRTIQRFLSLRRNGKCLSTTSRGRGQRNLRMQYRADRPVAKRDAGFRYAVDQPDVKVAR